MAGVYGLEITHLTDEVHPTIDWERMVQDIPFHNSDHFCHEDCFVAFYELMINLNTSIDDTMILEGARIIGRYEG